MKILNIYKSIGVVALAATLLVSCSELEFDIPVEQEVALTNGSADFSKYVAVGASFTAGVSDNALFIASQTNSWPNTLASQFSAAGGGDFNQPFVSDNIGGLLYGGTVIQPPRLYFNGAGPAVLPDAIPTTETTNVLTGPFNNVGVPGAKSYHLLAPGYGNLAGVPLGTANPFFARMASSPSVTMLEEAVSQNPTFFTLSEMGGNDVLSYSTSGGAGVDQTGNPDVTTYSGFDITDPGVFTASVTAAVAALTANGAKGCLTTVPYVTSLPFFTTVGHAPITPDAFENGQIAALNAQFEPLNQAFAFLGVPERAINFSETDASPIVIFDKDLESISEQLNAVLLGGGLDPLTAGLLSAQFGQSRQTTSADLVLLTSASVIASVNEANYQFLYESIYGALVGAGFPEDAAAASAAEQAGQLSVNGVTFPIADNFVLTEQETDRVINATDAYNLSVDAICTQYDLAKVDLRTILEEASQTGLMYDSFMMNTDLVFGGLVSLDGVHFTARGYSLMANKFLEAIDAKYGSNFVQAGQRAYANDFPVSYPLNL